MESHLYQELLNQYGVAVNYLHDLTREAKALREENELIRLANEDLTRHFGSLLSQPSVHQSRGVTSSTPSLTDDLRRFSASNKENHREIPNDAALSDNILTCAIESDRLDGTGPDRVSLPKSISVRSSGYLKVNQPAGNNVAGPSRAPNRSRMPSQPVDAARVYVKREEKTVEMDVYNQGMYKTELCNKWQETGACPYGDQCQFAHGLSELRPVLRHPRYKTNVCRMVLAGIICPYGHRCHFRHSVSDRERMMSPR
ncbi:hypothetical protein Nepgr_020857 [Nepenthes gracilis]|uniref:C3H1-type domain-containing protein n=1 Tax=Nepenthes gracilis TaxID=150966 RepID=A0AAD3SY16_NEPGR|nr:hypothetical protein Nepgr_020857 [Nepenthes gracilis]